MRFDWIIANHERIWDLALRHAWISVVPILASFLVAVPLGWWAHRTRWTRKLLLS